MMKQSRSSPKLFIQSVSCYSSWLVISFYRTSYLASIPFFFLGTDLYWSRFIVMHVWRVSVIFIVT
jgi:hypothetical protein